MDTKKFTVLTLEHQMLAAGRLGRMAVSMVPPSMRPGYASLAGSLPGAALTEQCLLAVSGGEEWDKMPKARRSK